jgi:hypothetical protein
VYELRGFELTGTNTPRPYSHFPLNFFPHFCVVVRKSRFEISGGHSGGATPGSMPNPDVKPSSAHGTAEAICGRVGRRQGSFFMPSSVFLSLKNPFKLIQTLLSKIMRFFEKHLITGKTTYPRR